ncbi:MAG: preprotein translocase subunit SecA [Tannerella sp.]|nr:preprotein translocase subunit SecA [Tannerella sp.]
MGFNNIMTKLFGNKSERDLKEITPYVKQITDVYPSIQALSNDDLRTRTQEIRQKVLSYVSEEKQHIEDLRSGIDDKELEEREAIWAEVDEIEKQIAEKFETVLEEVLPEIFAIVKDTARRFTENNDIAVTANDFDRELATKHDFVDIDGEQAVYHNHWMAGGNEIVWDMIHYDVQLFGGVVLHKGKIAEMATGEGKTLVATLPVFLNALTGKGVHVVTVNDYLSKRDSEWMGPLYMFHGLSVDCIDKHQPNSDNRRKAYNADITFGTNNEFGFDYLRDNMAISPNDLVQRKHNYAIVDEVDSVLIDDARTPLIISGPVSKGEEQLFDQFRSNVEIVYNAQKNLCTKLLAEAKTKMSSGNDSHTREEGATLLYRSFKGLPRNKALIKFLSEQGVKASMLKTEEYFMQDNMRKMPLLVNDMSDKDDEENKKIRKENEKIRVENTKQPDDAGTPLPEKEEKKYGSNALYFVIDEKNNSIELTEKGLDLLTGKSDDPYFFILPDIASELSQIETSGTDAEVQAKKDEILTNYSIKSERVHTINQLLKAYTLFERDDEYVVIEGQVKIVDEQTGRIMEGRRYSDGLHQAIESKERVKVEAATQTFATITLQNYFRMYHKLSGMTGTAETEAGELWNIYKLDVVVIPTNRPISRTDMNDRIYKTKREKYNAVIEEIGALIAAGRPVLVGTTSVEISELLSRMLNMRKIPHNVLNAKLHQREADIVAQAGQSGTVTIATNMAGRGTDIKLSPEVKTAGGLAIIGTERHESRRVDRQLRGRAGRQGDPGSSVFFVSLEDDLMRLFATERIAGWMDKMGFKEGDMLEANMLSKSVERAQKKVEENNFGIRKRLLEYDDVMNSQRNVIYTRRKHALMGERIGLDVMNTLYDATVIIVDQSVDTSNYEEYQVELFRTLAIESPFTEEVFHEVKAAKLTDDLFEEVLKQFKRRMERMAQTANPIIKQVYETQGATYENILIPISDGKRMYQISCNLKEAYETQSKAIVKSFQKSITLHTIDDAWKEHLREMDELRHSVQNASYENKDPLLIYKLESYNLFKSMVENMNRKTVSILMRGQIPMREEAAGIQLRQAVPEKRQDMSRYRTEKSQIGGGDPLLPKPPVGPQQPQRIEPIRAEKHAGRNDPCPCGSGKKYKNCHGKGL